MSKSMKDNKIEFIEEEIEYEIEKIISHTWFNEDGKKQLKYWIKWKGYPNSEDDTFEPEENLNNAGEALKLYWRNYYKFKRKQQEDINNDEFEKIKTFLPVLSKTLKYTITKNYPPKNMKNFEKNVTKIFNIYSKDNKFYIITEWKRKYITIHELDELKYKIPQNIISYFESRIVLASEQN